MILEGLFNPSHVIRLCISREYAFAIQYETSQIRVAHHKGGWYCGKLRNGKIEDHLIMYDEGSGEETENEMLKALIQTTHAQEFRKTSRPDGRDFDALKLEKVLRIWGGSLDKIKKISVVQPGRNAMVDIESGDFILSPRPEEFAL